MRRLTLLPLLILPLLAAAQEGYIVTHGVLAPFRG